MAVTLPCPVELWPLFSTLLDEALALPATSHEAWLTTLEGDRATLRPWLERVLAGAVPVWERTHRQVEQRLPDGDSDRVRRDLLALA